ncbi:MAG: hypothetical protein SOY08_06375 [Sodaliphilus sp.]|nr:hypothetical protein [Sodaliphilus sp.]
MSDFKQTTNHKPMGRFFWFVVGALIIHTTSPTPLSPARAVASQKV